MHTWHLGYYSLPFFFSPFLKVRHWIVFAPRIICVHCLECWIVGRPQPFPFSLPLSSHNFCLFLSMFKVVPFHPWKRLQKRIHEITFFSSVNILRSAPSPSLAFSVPIFHSWLWSRFGWKCLIWVTGHKHMELYSSRTGKWAGRGIMQQGKGKGNLWRGV